jgi:biotin synthase
VQGWGKQSGRARPDASLGMGETCDDRCDLAFALRELGVHIVPMIFLNPIAGMPFANCEPLPGLDILKAIVCFRFILPRQEIMVAGGPALRSTWVF